VTGWLASLLEILRAIGAWLVVRRAEQAVDAEHRAGNAEAYVATRKEIDHAEIVGDDPAAARRWLRERDGAGDGGPAAKG
jgi:hypothetical protein